MRGNEETSEGDEFYVSSQRIDRLFAFQIDRNVKASVLCIKL